MERTQCYERERGHAIDVVIARNPANGEKRPIRAQTSSPPLHAAPSPAFLCVVLTRRPCSSPSGAAPRSTGEPEPMSPVYLPAAADVASTSSMVAEFGDSPR